jgi:putative transposase
MTHDHSALLTQLDALVGADAGSMFAELIRAGLQALIDAEATQALGAGRYERTAERADYRNGTLSKTVATTSGDVEVQIPKLRSGWFFSESARAAAADRSSVVCGDHGGLRARRVDPQRR